MANWQPSFSWSNGRVPSVQASGLPHGVAPDRSSVLVLLLVNQSIIDATRPASLVGGDAGSLRRPTGVWRNRHPHHGRRCVCIGDSGPARSRSHSSGLSASAVARAHCSSDLISCPDRAPSPWVSSDLDRTARAGVTRASSSLSPTAARTWLPPLAYIHYPAAGKRRFQLQPTGKA